MLSCKHFEVDLGWTKAMDMAVNFRHHQPTKEVREKWLCADGK